MKLTSGWRVEFSCAKSAGIFSPTSNNRNRNDLVRLNRVAPLLLWLSEHFHSSRIFWAGRTNRPSWPRIGERRSPTGAGRPLVRSPGPIEGVVNRALQRKAKVRMLPPSAVFDAVPTVWVEHAESRERPGNRRVRRPDSCCKLYMTLQQATQPRFRWDGCKNKEEKDEEFAPSQTFAERDLA